MQKNSRACAGFNGFFKASSFLEPSRWPQNHFCQCAVWFVLGLPVHVHFWAPIFKWGISIANIADFAKPPEKISYPQQVAVTATRIIWSRYSMVITPKNWNLFAVNVAMAGTGFYQLSRKISQDYFSDEKEAAASLEG